MRVPGPWVNQEPIYWPRMLLIYPHIQNTHNAVATPILSAPLQNVYQTDTVGVSSFGYIGSYCIFLKYIRKLHFIAH